MLSGVFVSLISVALTLFATSPSSTNYTLKSYDLGNGGGGSSSSSNYKLNGNLGLQSGNSGTSSSYVLKPGETATQNSNVPPAPTLTNPSSEYSRLRLVINTGNNPSDTKFAIAISSDNFATTNFVKADGSIGNSLALTDYQVYNSWGGASGFWITGLSSNTTYKVKVKAMEGNFTESGYGPATAGVATVYPSISFGISTNPPSGPPYATSFNLTPSSVSSATAEAVLTLDTNSLSGGEIYVNDSNAGLYSASSSTTISSATDDLSSAIQGYGLQITSTSQSSGGPISSLSPYNGSSNNVGSLTVLLQKLATTSGPVIGASVSASFKAKASATTPASDDYADVVTFTAAMLY